MKEIVNTKIKFREPFRPFAPSILAERVGELLRRCPATTAWPTEPARSSCWRCCPVAEDKQETIPAVSTSGTGPPADRLRGHEPALPQADRAASTALTGVPVMLNTSFNLRGEPIVTTPHNALNTFFASGLDLLVLDDFLITKDMEHSALERGRSRSSSNRPADQLAASTWLRADSRFGSTPELAE